MKIVSIEPTPSPHSMKVNVDKILQDGETYNYQVGDNLNGAPDYIVQLLQVNGVKGIYQVLDFITIQRNPRTKWEAILQEVRHLLGATGELTDDFLAGTHSESVSFGEVQVHLQMFRDIPMQVKLKDGNTEQRIGLPDVFSNAVIEASQASENMLLERKWIVYSTRYGTLEQLGDTVVEELVASYDEERLAALVYYAFHPIETDESPHVKKTKEKITVDMLDRSDWKARYAALDRIMEPSVEDIPVLDKALDDSTSSVRRLATALLGMIEDKVVLPYLYKALKDKSVNVRRTAGDCLSDLGFKEAIPEMITSLRDPNRLVRWRAAMFLFEIGDETAIPALKATVEDPEFEVRMQVKMALDRIEKGIEGMGSIWKQMTDATEQR